jgi:hypothetical protein
VNPRSQVASIGAEREVMTGLFAGADYVHQHWTNLDRTVDLNAPTPFDRTAVGQTRSVAAANATRPIVPVNGGVRTVNVLMNLGVADYNGLQTHVAIRCRKPRTPPSRMATASDRTTPTSRDSTNRSAARACSISVIARSSRSPTRCPTT